MKLCGLKLQVNGTAIKNEWYTQCQVGVRVWIHYGGQEKRSSTRKRWTNTLEAEQALNVLYLAAAAAHNDTAFSHVTDRPVASTILSRCYSTLVDTTNTEPCCSASSIWDCSSSEPDMWSATLTGWVPQLMACRCMAAELYVDDLGNAA